MKKSKKQIKTEHFSNLIAVAFADGVLHEKELNLLKDKAEEFNVSKEDVQKLMDNAQNLIFDIPLNFEDKEQQLIDVVLMTMVDGIVHPKEYALCLKIAKKMDFDENYLDHIIKLAFKLWND